MDKSVKFLFLSQEDVAATGVLEDIGAIIDAEIVAYSMYDKGLAQDPVAPQIHFHGEQHGNIFAIHPAFIGGDINIAGMKLGARAPKNRDYGVPSITSLVEVIDPDTGHPFVIADGTLMTAYRTGATTAVGAKYFARKDSEVVGLIGASVMGRPQIMAICHILKNIKEIRLFDINQAKSEAFVAEMEPIIGKKITVVDSAEKSLKDADVIAPTTLVSVANAYIKAEWIKPGAYCSNISDNDYTFDAVKKMDKICIDSEKQFGIPVTMGTMIQNGMLKKEDTCKIGQVINGEVPGRENDKQICLFSSIGMGITDLIVTNKIYQVAREKGIGTELTLWNEPKWA
ncbi:MAG: ornithine cyclodeaminase family protein [Clostridia bacterium]